jgi:hypothetical protein
MVSAGRFYIWLYGAVWTGLHGQGGDIPLISPILWQIAAQD